MGSWPNLGTIGSSSIIGGAQGKGKPGEIRFGPQLFGKPGVIWNFKGFFPTPFYLTFLFKIPFSFLFPGGWNSFGFPRKTLGLI